MSRYLENNEPDHLQSTIALNCEQRVYPVTGKFTARDDLNEIHEREIAYELKEERGNRIVPRIQTVLTGRPITCFRDVARVFGPVKYANTGLKSKTYQEREPLSSNSNSGVPMQPAVDLGPYVPGHIYQFDAHFKVGDHVWWYIPPVDTSIDVPRDILFLHNEFIPEKPCLNHVGDEVAHHYYEYQYRYFGRVESSGAISGEGVLIRYLPVEGRFLTNEFARNVNVLSWMGNALRTMFTTRQNDQEVSIFRDFFPAFLCQAGQGTKVKTTIDRQTDIFEKVVSVKKLFTNAILQNAFQCVDVIEKDEKLKVTLSFSFISNQGVVNDLDVFVGINRGRMGNEDNFLSAPNGIPDNTIVDMVSIDTSCVKQTFVQARGNIHLGLVASDEPTWGIATVPFKNGLFIIDRISECLVDCCSDYLYRKMSTGKTYSSFEVELVIDVVAAPNASLSIVKNHIGQIDKNGCHHTNVKFEPGDATNPEPRVNIRFVTNF